MNGFDITAAAIVAVPLLAWIFVPRWIRAHDVRRQKAQRAPRPQGPPQAGEWVRLLVAIPEKGIEPGAVGRIRMIYPADDTEYWIQFEGYDGYAMFTREETWQFEVLNGKP